MSNVPVIAPSMTAEQIALLLEAHREPGVDVYVRIESYRGKPRAYMVREPFQVNEDIPAFLRRQAD